MQNLEEEFLFKLKWTALWKLNVRKVRQKINKIMNYRLFIRVTALGCNFNKKCLLLEHEKISKSALENSQAR